jgi:hypothetical protein
VDARAHPRTRLSVPVGLYCASQNTYYRRKISNISVGGLFVSGTPCGRHGSQLEVIVNPVNRELRPSDRYRAQVVRSSLSGFALRFNDLDEEKRRSLDEVIWPKWDGEKLFEGLLIIALHEDIADLAGWMRLTSILCNQYRRLCGKNHRYRLH